MILEKLYNSENEELELFEETGHINIKDKTKPIKMTIENKIKNENKINFKKEKEPKKEKEKKEKKIEKVPEKYSL